MRERLGFDPRNKDAGIEVGVEPGPLTVQVSLQNGEPGGTQDTVEGKLVAVRAELRLSLGALRLRPGGSLLRIEQADDTELRYGPLLWAAQCHGPGGRGDGPAASGLRDDQGVAVRAYDFTRPGGMKGGNRPADVYRTLATGMDGAPMPSYRDSIPAGDLWHLVHYLRSLVRPRTFWDWLGIWP